jgi:cell wall assembly regulator SMI1
MITFFESGKKITDKEVAYIEKKIGYCLPNEYREFLLKHNGGKCPNRGFVFMENSQESDSEVRSFYAVGGINGYYDLEENMDIYIFDEKRLPDFYIPIAEDDLGNLICISGDESDYGYIYFWDHEKEGEKENMYIIADSFNKFINNLKNFD